MFLACLTAGIDWVRKKLLFSYQLFVLILKDPGGNDLSSLVRIVNFLTNHLTEKKPNAIPVADNSYLNFLYTFWKLFCEWKSEKNKNIMCATNRGFDTKGSKLIFRIEFYKIVRFFFCVSLRPYIKTASEHFSNVSGIFFPSKNKSDFFLAFPIMYFFWIRKETDIILRFRHSKYQQKNILSWIYLKKYIIHFLWGLCKRSP